ncbi:reverse transcriptase-like protein [Neobacillus sp. PS2-9]|uniref:reverse transcriptase-like protein n=1 Tax=Neobacillus sp. PS2-9 TaxID=3070676 RepID=UPI0027E1793B|nr:reverse transcriptase-like protein [Neobacillus sp. PS2-9]WML59999.1 reverse transcriptase-like protein [Neobacillus sp. PS2-9]
MIEVYIDGASAGNPGPSGAGIFIKGNGLAEEYSLPLGTMSNHEAEFHAFIHALKICLEKGLMYSVVSFRTDSELINRAMEKEFVKNKQFSPLLDEALELSRKMELFFMKWIPSAENKVADRLARLAIQKNSSEGAL